MTGFRRRSSGVGKHRFGERNGDTGTPSVFSRDTTRERATPFSDENTERSLAYDKKLLAKNTFKAFIVSFSSRESVQSAKRIVTRLRDAGCLTEPDACALLTCIEGR